MSRSFSVHTVCVCALFCWVIICRSLVASLSPVSDHTQTHTHTHTHTHRPVGCWGAGSASLWGSSECQLPAAVCAERTVQRKRNVLSHPSACSSLPLHRWGLLLHTVTPTLSLTATHSQTLWKLLVQLHMLDECTSISQHSAKLSALRKYVCSARISLSLLSLLNFIFTWMWQFLFAQNSQVLRCKGMLCVVS